MREPLGDRWWERYPPVADTYVSSGKTTILAIVWLVVSSVASVMLLTALLRRVFWRLDSTPEAGVFGVVLILGEVIVFFVPVLAGIPVVFAHVFGNRNVRLPIAVGLAATTAVYVQTGMLQDTFAGLSLNEILVATNVHRAMRIAVMALVLYTWIWMYRSASVNDAPRYCETCRKWMETRNGEREDSMVPTVMPLLQTGSYTQALSRMLGQSFEDFTASLSETLDPRPRSSLPPSNMRCRLQVDWCSICTSGYLTLFLVSKWVKDIGGVQHEGTGRVPIFSTALNHNELVPILETLIRLEAAKPGTGR